MYYYKLRKRLAAAMRSMIANGRTWNDAHTVMRYFDQWATDNRADVQRVYLPRDRDPAWRVLDDLTRQWCDSHHVGPRQGTLFE